MPTALLAFLIIIVPVGAQDLTSYTVKTTNPATFLYNPELAQSASASITLQRGNNANVSYPYYYIVSGALQGFSGVGQRKLYQDGQVSKPSIPIYLRLKNSLKEIGASNIAGATGLAGVISRGDPSTVEFDVALEANSGIIPDGTYSNQFTFKLYTNTALAPTVSLVPPNGQEAMSVQGSLTILITATVSLSSVTVSFSSLALSFGVEMVAGGTYETGGFVNVKATKPFSLIVHSQNFGTIKLGESETIAYRFLFDGTTYSLNSGTVAIGGGSLPAGTQSYPIRFILEDLPNSEAGHYSDVITFNFSTQ
jgi:hypothetical protein